MKKQVIAGMILAFGIVAGGAMSASAANSCGKCAESKSMQQYQQETSALSRAVAVKNTELRELYLFETIDLNKAEKIEAELQDLKNGIENVANKYGIPPCSRS